MTRAPLRVLSVVGARPNFMKVAPIAKVLGRQNDRFRHLLVHTGQHYDDLMSGAFFRTLGLPAPDVNLEIKSGSHAEQTGMVMIRLEPVLAEFRPDLVIVVGDVNSTLAAALAAKKLDMRVAHVEAGLRSGDWSMPEEINRLATDAISDMLFTTDRFADANLRREGVADARIHLVGNVMIDSLLAHLPAAEALRHHETLGLTPGRYATMTLHRPANVENRDKLAEILDAILAAIGDLPVVFASHPRTRRRVAEFGLAERFVETPRPGGIWLTDPLGYLEFMGLNRHARLVLTDSGGLQEETTILGVPCVTIRDNTERPVTIEDGTNILAGTSGAGIRRAIADSLQRPATSLRRPPLWDGQAAERIVSGILARLGA
jgi:UDP-N-acetylglucosamine 2-epimerase (non-hydrolysing)